MQARPLPPPPQKAQTSQLQSFDISEEVAKDLVFHGIEQLTDKNERALVLNNFDRLIMLKEGDQVTTTPDGKEKQGQIIIGFNSFNSDPHLERNGAIHYDVSITFHDPKSDALYDHNLLFHEGTGIAVIDKTDAGYHVILFIGNHFHDEFDWTDQELADHDFSHYKNTTKEP